MSKFEYTFPAVRGIQAGRCFFSVMCPVPLLRKIFLFDEEEVPADVRAQRTLGRSRIPKLTQYIVDNPGTYVFSALTASIDGDTRFEPASAAQPNIGALHVPMTAKFLINDGQHRRAALEEALKERPGLADESVAVVFFSDRGLARSQQMFTDLNQHSVKPSRSLGLLYDQRSDRAWLAREVANRAQTFRGRIELERSTLARRSSKMFTLSAIESTNRVLLSEHKDLPPDEQAGLGAQFWDEVSKYIPEWQAARRGHIGGGDHRQGYICAHGVALAALAHCGRTLLSAFPDEWRDQLAKLEGLDWSRSNTETWEGRAMTAGRISKSSTHVRLTAAVLKRRLGLPLSIKDAEAEAAAGLSTLRLVEAS